MRNEPETSYHFYAWCTHAWRVPRLAQRPKRNGKKREEGITIRKEKGKEATGEK